MRWLVLVVVSVFLAGCPPAPVCGNGKVEEGETEATCCADAGCAFGACVEGACTPPWVGCSAGACDGPYVCAADAAPPAYDCATCGCTDGDACTEVCTSAATRALERSEIVVADDLDVSEYVRLYSELGAAPAVKTVADVASSFGAAMRADPRVDTLLIGALDGADVDTLKAALLGGLGVSATPTKALGRLGSDACAQLGIAASAGVLPATFVTAVVNDDAATKFTCPYPGTFPACVLPQGAECVLGAGRFAATAVLMDARVALPVLDRALLVRAGSESPALVGRFLDDGLAAFSLAASLVRDQPGLVVGDRVAAAYATEDPLVFVVVMADFDARPVQLGSFRAVWNDTLAQTFLVDNDIQAKDCTFTVSGDTATVHCVNGTATLDAVVDTGNFTLGDVTTHG